MKRAKIYILTSKPDINVSIDEGTKHKSAHSGTVTEKALMGPL